MSAITPANMSTCLDKLCRAYSSLVGTSASDMGIGELGAAYGAQDAVADIRALIVGAGDYEQIGDTLPNLSAAVAKITASAVSKTLLGPVIGILGSHAQRRSGNAAITTLEAFLTYYNCTHATKWQCLAPSQWHDLYYAVYGQRPAANNVYFEVLQGAAYANGLRKLVVGTDETAGATIDPANYAGGFPQLKVSSLTGTGVVTVTGTEFNPATKTYSAGKTWTVSVSGTGTVSFTGGTRSADALIVAVSAISAAAGITAGTLYVEAARPSGRPQVS